MLKVRLSKAGGGHTFILGLDANNVRELQKGHPIPVHLKEIGGTDEVVIVYGNTLEAIATELEEWTGSKIPEQWKTPQGQGRKQ